MFDFFRNKTLSKIIATIGRCEGGIHKRIDENRELLELIQADAPELLRKNPWIVGWLGSQDNFLNQIVLASDCNKYPDVMIRQEYTRPWPIVDVKVQLVK